MPIRNAMVVFAISLVALIAAPQAANDGEGITVDTGGAVLHRPGITYPPDAAARGIQGTVVVQARVNDRGSVVDAQVVSGPDELRKAALASVLNWHFENNGGATRRVSITFEAPAPKPVNVVPQLSTERTIRSIVILGIPERQKSELLSLLAQAGVTEGAQTADASRKASQAAASVDEHLVVSARPSSNGEVDLIISVPQSVGSAGPAPIRVGAAVQNANLISQVHPQYPPLAKAAGVQGTVTFEAFIGRDGHVQNLHLISGHPLLVQAAMQAAQQWVYKPTLLNGNPVDVMTNIEITFALVQ